MIWIWSVPNNVTNKRIGEYVPDSGTDRFVFREGLFLSQEIVPPKVIFECHRKYLFDVLPNDGFLIIVSGKVVEIFNELCPQDVQVFKANVQISGQEIPNYYLVNVVNSLDILDKEKSDYSTIRGTNTILDFKKLVYKFDDLKGHHIARNLDYKSHVLVSDKLRRVFIENQIREVAFE